MQRECRDQAQLDYFSLTFPCDRFLLAHLNVIYICQQVTANNISKELREIKKVSSGRGNELDDVYDRAIGIITKGPSVELALRVLSWLSNSMRVLNVEELRIAVSIEKNQQTLDPDSIPAGEMLADICAGLVTIEESSNKVRLAHYTTQEYLSKKSVVPEYLRNGYHATICATHLAFDKFKNGACYSEWTYKLRHRRNPFLCYAAKYLSIHLKASDESCTIDCIIALIQNSSCISAYLQAKSGRIWYRWMAIHEDTMPYTLLQSSAMERFHEA